MDNEIYSSIPGANNATSLLELQEQSLYTLDVHILKGAKITGGFGKTLYNAQWIDQNESPIVLVEIRGNKVSEEVYHYITLDHPRIIKTYGLVNPNDHPIDPNSVLLLQEYAKDGDLGGLLLSRHFIPEQNVLLEIFIQVADAMVFLSESGVIHGDLACRNVLVFKSHSYDPKRNSVKLIDFGLTQTNSQSSTGKNDIPIRSVAQEILRSQGRSNYSQKSEVYSFGVFMWEACSFGKIPYAHIDDDNEVCRQKLQGQRLTQPDKCDPNIWKLMNLCWNDTPDDRPTFEVIYKQLKSIQNVETSSTYSNPPLFQIEYKVCKDCTLRYTDAASHLKSCSEQKLTCYKCNKEYRRAIYDDHEKNCNGPSVYTSSTIDDRSHSHAKFDSKKNTHPRQERSSLSPGISTRPKSVESSRKSVPENLPKAEKIVLPCEICNEPIDASQFQLHQIECKKRDEERIERERRKIEQTKTEIQIKCDFCHEKFSVEDYYTHENICSYNPENVSDTPPRHLSDRSLTISDFKTISGPLNTPHESRNDPHSRSSVNLRTFEISETLEDVKAAKPSMTKNKKEPSAFRKLISRVLPFRKKKQ